MMYEMERCGERPQAMWGGERVKSRKSTESQGDCSSSTSIRPDCSLRLDVMFVRIGVKARQRARWMRKESQSRELR